MSADGRPRAGRAGRRRLLATALTAVAAAATTAASAPYTVTPAPTINGMDTGISPLLDATYMGVGIEPSNLLSFTSPTGPNKLTNQLLTNIAGYMGAPPHIRVGGNTGDNMLWDPSNTSLALDRNPHATGQGNPGSQVDSWTYGPGYYAALDNFPKNTPITFGLNLAYDKDDALTRIVTQAQSLIDALKNVQLNSLEVGNEPDLYIDNKYRNSSWTTQDFGDEWFQRADAVYKHVLQPKGLPTDMFEAAVTATTATKTGHAFRIVKLISTGVGSNNGKYLRGWNQHDYFYYIGVSNFNLTYSRLLDLPAMTQQFTEWTNQAKQANATGKPYFVREMGSVGPTGIQGLSDTFANTLWTVNFFLFAASVGVSSVQIHMTDNSFAAPWQPNVQNGVGPHVRSSYYAFAAMAQLLGTGCNTNIAGITVEGVPDEYTNRIAAYGIYRRNTLQSIVLLNTNPYGPQTEGAGAAPSKRQQRSETLLQAAPVDWSDWSDWSENQYANALTEHHHAHRLEGGKLQRSLPHAGGIGMGEPASDPVKRDAAPTVTFTVNLPDHKGKTFWLSTLAAQFSGSTSNTTWNGMEYESSGDGKPHHINNTQPAAKQKSIQVGSDGTLSIPVSDSSIVVANLGVILGSDDGHPSLCVSDARSSETGKGGTGSSPLGFTGAPKDSKGKLSTPSIIGIAAGGGGGLAVLAAIAGIVAFCCVKRKRRERDIQQALSQTRPSKGGKTDYLAPPGKRGGLFSHNKNPRGAYAQQIAQFAPSREKLLSSTSLLRSGSNLASGSGMEKEASDEYALSDRMPGVRFATAHPTGSSATLVPTSSSPGIGALGKSPDPAADNYAYGYGYGYHGTGSPSPVAHANYADDGGYGYNPGYGQYENYEDHGNYAGVHAPRGYHGYAYGYGEGEQGEGAEGVATTLGGAERDKFFPSPAMRSVPPPAFPPGTNAFDAVTDGVPRGGAGGSRAIQENRVRQDLRRQSTASATTYDPGTTTLGHSDDKEDGRDKGDLKNDSTMMSDLLSPRTEAYDITSPSLASPQLYSGESDAQHGPAPSGLGFGLGVGAGSGTGAARSRGSYGALPTSSPGIHSPDRHGAVERMAPPSPSDASIYSRATSPVDSRLATGMSGRYSGLGLDMDTMDAMHHTDSMGRAVNMGGTEAREPPPMYSDLTASTLGSEQGRTKEPNPYDGLHPSRGAAHGSGPSGLRESPTPDPVPGSATDQYAAFAHLPFTPEHGQDRGDQRRSRALVVPRQGSIVARPSARDSCRLSAGMAMPLSPSIPARDAGLAEVGTALLDPSLAHQGPDAASHAVAPGRAGVVQTRELDLREVNDGWPGAPSPTPASVPPSHSLASLSSSDQFSGQQQRSLYQGRGNKEVPQPGALQAPSASPSPSHPRVQAGANAQGPGGQRGTPWDTTPSSRTPAETNHTRNPIAPRTLAGSTSGGAAHPVSAGGAHGQGYGRQAYAEWYATQYGDALPPPTPTRSGPGAFAAADNGAVGGTPSRQDVFSGSPLRSPVRSPLRALATPGPGGQAPALAGSGPGSWGGTDPLSPTNVGGDQFGGYPSQEAYNQAYYQYYAQYYEAQARAAAQAVEQGTHTGMAPSGGLAPQYSAHEYRQQQQQQQQPYPVQQQHLPPGTGAVPFRNARDAVKQARGEAQNPHLKR